jgi:hypothetical protein
MWGGSRCVCWRRSSGSSRHLCDGPSCRDARRAALPPPAVTPSPQTRLCPSALLQMVPPRSSCCSSHGPARPVVAHGPAGVCSPPGARQRPLCTTASNGTATTVVSAAARIAPAVREDRTVLGGVSMCRCGGVTRPLRLQLHLFDLIVRAQCLPADRHRAWGPARGGRWARPRPYRRQQCGCRCVVAVDALF